VDPHLGDPATVHVVEAEPPPPRLDPAPVERASPDQRWLGAASALMAFILIAGTLLSCTSGPKRLDKAEFIARWDAICQGYRDRLDAVGTSLPSSPSQENLGEFVQPLRQAETLLRQETVELTAVLPPKDDQALVTSILADLAAVSSVYRALLDAAVAGNLAAFQSAENGFAEPATRASRTAMDYGLKVCGQ
jgi:hypothetical protein